MARRNFRGDKFPNSGSFHSQVDTNRIFSRIEKKCAQKFQKMHSPIITAPTSALFLQVELIRAVFKDRVFEIFHPIHPLLL